MIRVRSCVHGIVSGARPAILALVCMMLLPAAAVAQSYTYSRVQVDGIVRIDVDSVLRFAELPASGTVSAAKLSAGYRGLAESGQFEDIAIEVRDRTLFIAVTEYPTINEIAIEGNERLKDDVLTPLIKSESRRVYNPALAEEDASAIADAYRVAGRYAATVTPKIIRRTENRVDLVFEVIEGRVIETERIGFIGNEIYSSHRLRRVLSSKQAGILRTFVRSDTFLAERIELDKELLEEFYLERGYLDFRILSVTSELTTERDAFFVVFTIHEGQQYRFGNVTVETDVSGLDIEAYAAQSKIRGGDIYSPKAIVADSQRMEFLAAQEGRAFVRAVPSIDRDDFELRADITFSLELGERAFLERIDIEGNSTTLDRVVRREFEIAEGDPYNQRKVDEAVTRIRRLGHFSTVEATTLPGSSPDRVVVVVSVEERLTGSLSFGATYSKDDGVSGTISLSESNLLGRGQFLSFGISTGNDSSYDLTFMEPHFLDRDVEFRLETSYVRTNTDNEQYSTTQWSFQPSVRFFISDTSRLQLGVGLSSYELSGVTSSSKILVDDFLRGKGDNVSARYLLDYDSRRAAFNPEIGIAFEGGQKFTYGTNDNSVAIRSTALLGGYTTLFSEDVRVSAELEMGILNSSGGPSRLRDRFHMSNRIMRGFAANGIGPRDFELQDSVSGDTILNDFGTKEYHVPLGGNYFAVTRLESRFPLGASQDVGISGGVFLDAGSIWGLDDTRCGNYNAAFLHDQPTTETRKALCTVDDSMHLRSAVGFSLFWTSFLGPFRFNFAHDLKSQPYDTPQAFNIELASTF